ncbi:hypothetical protein GCM10009540_72320 [Streptomyces turgidiscabies]
MERDAPEPPHPGRRQVAVPTRRRSTWRRDEKYRDWATMNPKLAKRPAPAQAATDGRDGTRPAPSPPGGPIGGTLQSAPTVSP